MTKKVRLLLCLVVPATIGLCLQSGIAKAAPGVVRITQAKALAGGVTPDDAPGFPVTISLPGSYRLATNLVGTHIHVNVIEISASDVSLGLNGFSIFGPGFIGIASNSDTIIDNIAVRNGTIRGMTSSGVAITSGFGGTGFIVTGVRALDNGGDGISLNGANIGSVVADNIASGNGGHGIVMTGAGLDPENGYGIARANVATRNAGIGLIAAEGAVVTQNATWGNSGGGIQTFGGNTIKDNTSVENGTFGIDVRGKSGVSLVVNNVASRNNVGIIMIESGGLLRGNTAERNSGFGFVLNGPVGYTNNVLILNNGGPSSPQLDGGTELGADTNLCGTDTTCP